MAELDGTVNFSDGELVGELGAAVIGGIDLPLERGSGTNSWKTTSATEASGDCSHAEGYISKAKGYASHAEGFDNTASGGASHAEGRSTTASGDYSHAEGVSGTASGYASHVEGSGSIASAGNSHAEGNGTIAASSSQHVQGKYNVEDRNEKYAHIVGGGSSDRNRRNIHTIDWDGNAYYAGSLTLADVTLSAEQLRSLLVNGGAISHVGMIVQSTTLDTMEKVIQLYGGTKWQLIQGKFLLGTSVRYPVNSTGGSEDGVTIAHRHHVPSVTPATTTLKYAAGTSEATVVAGLNINSQFTQDTIPQDYEGPVATDLTDLNMPPYKTVYIWERTE